MRRPLTALLLLLLLPALAQAQSVKLPAEVKAQPGMILVVAETESPNVEWWVPDGGLQIIPSDLLKSTKTAVCFSVTPGRYRLVAMVAKGDKPAYATTTVIVGDAPPVPPGPGPGPGPGPKPDPKPDPKPAREIRVLILEETADRGKLPAAQLQVLFAKPVHDWLNANCRPWQGIKDWGIFDQHTDISTYSPELNKLKARPRNSLPWIVIDSDQGVLHEGPLPPTVPATLDLLGRHAPANKGGR